MLRGSTEKNVQSNKTERLRAVIEDKEKSLTRSILKLKTWEVIKNEIIHFISVHRDSDPHGCTNIPLSGCRRKSLWIEIENCQSSSSSVIPLSRWYDKPICIHFIIQCPRRVEENRSITSDALLWIWVAFYFALNWRLHSPSPAPPSIKVLIKI